MKIIVETAKNVKVQVEVSNKSEIPCALVASARREFVSWCEMFVYNVVEVSNEEEDRDYLSVVVGETTFTCVFFEKLQDICRRFGVAYSVYITPQKNLSVNFFYHLNASLV